MSGYNEEFSDPLPQTASARAEAAGLSDEAKKAMPSPEERQENAYLEMTSAVVAFLRASGASLGQHRIALTITLSDEMTSHIDAVEVDPPTDEPQPQHQTESGLHMSQEG